jgi:hypothetical protein
MFSSIETIVQLIHFFEAEYEYSPNFLILNWNDAPSLCHALNRSNPDFHFEIQDLPLIKVLNLRIGLSDHASQLLFIQDLLDEDLDLTHVMDLDEGSDPAHQYSSVLTPYTLLNV